MVGCVRRGLGACIADFGSATAAIRSKMLRNLIAGCLGVVVAATATYAAFTALSNKCSSRGATADWVHNFVCDVRASEFVIAAFSVFLALLAGLLVGIVHQLWMATRRNAQAQKRDTEIIQRAYLSAHPLGVSPFDAAAYAEGHVGIRNTGRLPARKVRWFIDVATSSDGRRTHFPLGELSGNNVVHGGAEMRQGGRAAISRQEFQNFHENSVWVYVWGTIRYDDGFGNERHIDFCHRYDSSGFSPRGAGITPQQALQLGRAALSPDGATYHQHGNDAD